jgi:tripartite-type tricarboxylate transporter receptor subunit TctC
LAGELFKAGAGLDIVHVPYKGGGQAMTDLMSGQVAVMFNVLPSALPQIKAGTVKALAVTGRERASVLPDLPTMIESGVSNYTAFTWNGLLAPSATPPQVILAINTAIQKILATPEMAKRYASLGTDVMSGAPDTFKRLIQDETKKWRQIIDSNGLKAD